MEEDRSKRVLTGLHAANVNVAILTMGSDLQTAWKGKDTFANIKVTRIKVFLFFYPMIFRWTELSGWNDVSLWKVFWRRQKCD